ncbi:MAG: glycoside hydrolase family 3 N-terminal domain-containing protein [Ilumatobacteraceae bacterium]
MTVDEQASLTAGASAWSTAAVPRVGIPEVFVSDGPAGARGPLIPGVGPQVTTLNIPCGSALGSTWNPELLEQLGRALGDQARTKACRVLLAPTVNLHRAPLAGRNFEAYSEDPLLTGKLAAAFIRGVQSQGVATTVKHFAGNEAEFERMTIDSVIDQRTLRELYLLPFELAVTEGRSLGIMTSYNRLNGTYNTEHRWLLQELLRDEWVSKASSSATGTQAAAPAVRQRPVSIWRCRHRHGSTDVILVKPSVMASSMHR